MGHTNQKEYQLDVCSWSCANCDIFMQTRCSDRVPLVRHLFCTLYKCFWLEHDFLFKLFLFKAISGYIIVLIKVFGSVKFPYEAM